MSQTSSASSRRKHLTKSEADALGWLSRTELAQQYRMKPAPEQKPAGTVWQGHFAYDVYAISEATHMRPYKAPTEAQRAALARGRELRGTQACASSGCPERVDLVMWEGPLCPACDERKRRKYCINAFKRWEARGGLVIDVETTGLDWDAEIIELCVLDQHGNTLIDTLVKPTGPVPEEASAIHGIYDHDLTGAPTWPEIHDRVYQTIEGRALLTYNAVFERRMLIEAALKYGKPPPQLSTFCAMELFAEWHGETTGYGDYRWRSLGDAAAIMGITRTGQHRAKDDCITTLALARAIIRETL